VAWNPWREGAKALADLGDEEWREFACVEASNIIGYAVELGAGEKHTMTAVLSVGH
jgi:glucose-6-phosphate 1-epimerase